DQRVEERGNMSSEEEDIHSEEEEALDYSDDEEEEEEEAPSKKRKGKASAKKKKSKKPKVSRFIDDIADEASGDESEGDAYGDEYESERRLAEQEEEELEDQSHHQYQRQRSRPAFADDSFAAEEYVENIKKRHSQSRRMNDDGDEESEGVMQSAVAQQSLLPSIQDPRLWVFKCKPGREQHLVLALMNKFLEFEKRGESLNIKSVVASSSKGFIYVESDREPFAKEAVNGLRDIQQWSMKLVPIHEMTAVLTIHKKKTPIVAGVWARFKRAGLYKGDLCKVIEIVDNGLRAIVKHVPRLDPSVLSGGEPTKYKKGQRPALKLFAASSVSGPEVSRKRHPLTNEMMDTYDNDWFKDGFLFKEVNIATMLSVDDVNPTLEEINKFSSAPDADSDNEQSHVAKLDLGDVDAWKNKVDLTKGDTVKVIEGDLVNLMGVVVGTNAGNDTVRVMPLHEEIKDTILDFSVKQLVKIVKVGAHIKVISGRYSGETGTVVSIDESMGAPVAIILVDTQAKEIQVRVRDIQESAEVSQGLDSLKGKELYDLVALPHGEVGVITHVGRDGFTVLGQNGQPKTIADQEIQRKLYSARVSALDKKGNHISVGEMAQVVDGPYVGQTGTIKHIYRSYVFLHNNRVANNAGIFLVRNKQIEIAGEKVKSYAMGGTGVSTAGRGDFGGRGGRGGRGDFGGRGGRGGGRGGAFSDLVGKTVTIKRGQWKGYIGMVIDESEATVKVEIHSKAKCVDIEKKNISLAGDRNGVTRDQGSHGGMSGSNAFTPMATATPLHHGMTPMATPLHQPRTPSRSSYNSGSRTPRDAWSTANDDALLESHMPQEKDITHASSFGTPLEPAVSAELGVAPTYRPTSYVATPGNQNNNDMHSVSTPGMLNPTTPGFQQGPYSTPGMAPTTPFASTPGLPRSMAQTPMQMQTPYQAQNSFGPTTPGLHMNPTTPGLHMNPTTPGLHMNPMTPGYTPMNPTTPGIFGGSKGTPAAVTPHHGGGIGVTPAPMTPADQQFHSYDSGYSHGVGASSGNENLWMTNGVVVEVTSVGEYFQAEGTIVSVAGDSCMLNIRGKTVSFHTDSLKHVIPEKQENVLILVGEEAGKTGSLIGTDAPEDIITSIFMFMSSSVVTPVTEDGAKTQENRPAVDTLPQLDAKILGPIERTNTATKLSAEDAEIEDMRAKIRSHIGESIRVARAQKRRQHRRICGLSRADVYEWVRSVFCCSDVDSAAATDDSDAKVLSTKKFLGGVKEFACLTDRELSQLARLTELRTFKRDDVPLLNEDKADGLYIVMSGKASRSILVNGAVDESVEPESVEYQETFGIDVSPTPDNEDVRVETSITAVSPTLECLWLPKLVIRMLNLQPRLEYEFVVVLKNHEEISDAEYKQQETVLANILQAGIHATVMANTRNTSNKIILLLSAPLWLLAREDKLMKMERIIEYHSEEDAKSLGDEYSANAEILTASDRLSAFASILTRSTTDKPPGAGLRGIENNQDFIIHDVFPLHDPSMSDFITSSWYKEALSASTRQLFLLRMKDHFGLRIAFYTAFIRLYCTSLSIPCIVGVLMWVIWRHVDYTSYMQAMGIYGLLVALVWAPSVLKRWTRYQYSLRVDWDLLQAKDIEYPNPEFKHYVIETINVANEGDAPDYVDVKVYDNRRRYPKYISFFVFSVICCILLFGFVMLYAQWYIVAVMTPMCVDPRCPVYLSNNQCISQCQSLLASESYNFLNPIRVSPLGCQGYCNTSTFDPAYYSCDTPLVGCFGTERGIVGTARWTYVLVQGIVLGLTLDIIFLAVFELIASVFNKWENYATIQEFERRFIEKIFIFNWVGYFYWFFLLAFLYTPYGDLVEKYIRENIDTIPWLTGSGRLKFSRYWIKGLVAMDTAFVTPLIVTQALNLVINTFVPYLLRRAVITARDKYLVGKDQLSMQAMKIKNGLKAQQIVLQNGVATTTHTAAANVRRASQRALAMLQGPTKVLEMPQKLEDNEIAPDEDLTALEKEELAQYLAERKPIKAGDVEATIEGLFANLSSHQSRMTQICSNIRREELDAYQLTSYDWIDKVTQDIEHNKKHDSIWEDSLSKGKSQETQQHNSLRLRLIKDWRCRDYNYDADRIMEESSMPVYSPSGDLLHMAIQFSYIVMFSVIWPFCALCAYCNNIVALRFDAIKMTIDCKRAVPHRMIGIGPWYGAFMFETLIATMVVPAIFVYVTGQMDSYQCTIDTQNYGPVEGCFTPLQRLLAFCFLENVGIAICFLVYLRKGDISTETSIKIQEHSRRLKHNVRKSVRTIGEHILVHVHYHHDAVKHHGGEWRQGTVAWVKNGRVKVNFYSTALLGQESHSTEHEVWLQNERYTLKSPIPVKIFELNMPILLASPKKGHWLEGIIVGMDTIDRFGKELVHRPNEMHLTILEGRNLRSYMMRNVLDPYCVISCGSFKHMTSIKRHTLNPLWNEQLVFALNEKEIFKSEDPSTSEKIKLAVYNHDTLSLGECIGDAEIDLSQHRNGKKAKFWVPLALKKHVLNIEMLGSAVHKMALGEGNGPQICIELQWIDTRLPTQVHVQILADGPNAKPRTLNRKFCEKRLCYGIVPEEIKEGRIFNSTDL
ncbi:transcription elongation factor SPT5, partial [Thraustotheca clavata]